MLKITSYFLIPELFVCINYEKAERNNNFNLGSKKLKKKKKKLPTFFCFLNFCFRSSLAVMIWIMIPKSF